MSARVTAFAGATLFAALLLPAGATGESSAIWRTVQYHQREQVRIACGIALLCEIELQPGERVHDGLGAVADMWETHLAYSGDGAAATQHIVLKPKSVGLRENVIVTTSRRVYRLFLSSTPSQRPTYVNFRFDQDDMARDRHLERMRSHERAREAMAHPGPVATPVATLEQACSSAAQPSWRMDATPAEYHPRQVCQSSDHTFIALPLTSTQPSDLPIPLAVTHDGDRPVNYRYDATARVFVLDGTASEYALIATAGRHSIRMRVQRVQHVDEVKS